ncbi:DUF2271 domain-containing protein [Colwellia psychrerythraea]|uniref:Putative conserved protein UCP014995 n=1 Tax=Colwellia psychrerythraea TaxID=28229 RepID=A0A099KJS6_COLPS|nr:DUF2271 domain-containing protein [Colwellia psychrerythraea]KGJ90606.1 putative conserved protein UCP014995 [Colwellia psychrerythraea]
MKTHLSVLPILACTCLLLASPNSLAQQISVEITIPKITTQPYHKPYVAVWIETQKRQGVHTLAFWHEQKDWFKDVRQWWRKIGRQQSPAYDQVTGATRKPGTYTLKISSKELATLKLNPGEYFLNVEAVREEGGREFIRQKITLGATEIKRYEKLGKHELGKVIISVMP